MKSYSPTSQTNTPTHIHEKTVIKIKIQSHINQAAKGRNFAQHELQKEKANDRKQLYEANHLHLMIEIDKEKRKKKTTTSKPHS